MCGNNQQINENYPQNEAQNQRLWQNWSCFYKQKAEETKENNQATVLKKRTEDWGDEQERIKSGKGIEQNNCQQAHWKKKTP